MSLLQAIMSPFELSWLQGINVERVETRDAVGLGPEGHPSGCAERLIGGREQLTPVERDRKAVALGAQRQPLPLISGDRDIGASQLRALPSDHLVETYVGFQSVRTHEVVVVRVAEPHRKAAGLVHAPCDRLYLGPDLNIRRHNGGVNQKRKSVLRRVLAHLCDSLAAGCPAILHHLPTAGLARTRLCRLEVLWHDTERCVSKGQLQRWCGRGHKSHPSRRDEGRRRKPGFHATAPAR